MNNQYPKNPSPTSASSQFGFFDPQNTQPDVLTPSFPGTWDQSWQSAMEVPPPPIYQPVISPGFAQIVHQGHMQSAIVQMTSQPVPVQKQHQHLHQQAQIITGQPQSQETDVKKRKRNGKAKLEKGKEEVPFENTAEGIKLVEEVGNTIEILKAEMKQMKASVEDTVTRIYLMKEDEIALEERLLENDTHPELLKNRSLIQRKFDNRCEYLNYRRFVEFESANQLFEDGFKFANETYLDRRRKIRSELINRISSKRYKLMSEYEGMTNKHRVPLLSETPQVINKRRKFKIRQLHSTNIYEYPDWLKKAITKRRNEDEQPNIVPPSMCESATECEKDEDIGFIKLLVNY